jgi:dienelactone hydrolase
MKKKIAGILILIFVSGLLFSYFYSKRYAESFLTYTYQQRKTKCQILTPDGIKELSKKYSLTEDSFITIGSEEYQFHAIDLPSENMDYIILIHGKRECPFAMLRGGLKLHQMGFSILIPVLFSHGMDSTNSIIDYGKYSLTQIDSCVNYLEKKGANHIGISGRSMGASLAIIAAGRNNKIDAIAAECPLSSVESSISYKHELYSKLPNFPFINFKIMAVKQLLNDNLDSLAAKYFISRLSPRPLLLMAATKDKVINPKDFNELFHLAGEPKIWWEAPIDHTKFHSQLSDEFYIRLPAFFQEAFRTNDFY